ncbi:hypothetical protein EXW69_09545, partial [Francisella tularensis subsp. mediasiatica]
AKKVIDYSQEFLVDSLPTRLETFKSRVYCYDFSSVGGDDKLDHNIQKLPLKLKITTYYNFSSIIKI